MSPLKRFQNSIALSYLMLILGTFILVSLILGTTFLVNSYISRMETINNQALERATFISAVVPEAVYTQDFLTLENLMRQTVQDPLIVYAIVLDKSGRPMTRYIHREDPLIELALAEFQGQSGGILAVTGIVDEQPYVRTVSAPIVSEGIGLGEVRLGYTVSTVRAQVIRTSWQVLGVLFLSSLILAAVTVVLFNLRVGRPLLEVRDLAQSLAKGDLSHRAQLQTDQNDELAQLKRAFNTMADRLQETLTGLHLSQEQTEKLSMVAARTDNMVIISDAQGRIEWVNEAFTRVTGYQLDEVAGRTPGSILQGQGTDPKTVDYMRSRLTAQEGFTAEVLNYDKHGQEYWIHVEVQPVLDDHGVLLNYIALESDITQRRANEAALRQAKEGAETANRAKSIFLANMSHELRTPLNAIIGYSDMLLEDYGLEEQPEVAKDLKRIQSAGKHLLALISDILDISKVEAGRMEIYLEVFEPGQLLHEVVDTVNSLIQQNKNRLILDLPQEETVMESDLTKVRQILFNLLSNAAKFTENGTITVTMRRVSHAQLAIELEQFRNTDITLDEDDVQSVSVLLAPEDAPQNGTASVHGPPQSDWIRFSVSDTGIGMEASQIESVFQAFRQGDVSTTREYGGTGLGLAISHRFSQILGGTIQVRSTPGKGTTFCVCLPQRADRLSQDKSAPHMV